MNRSLHPLIWTATHINTSNLSNVYLYVSRKTGDGTTPHSVNPTKYLSKIKKHNIELDSLNVPSKCPTINKQELQQFYNLNEQQCETAQDTIKSLWNIVQSHKLLSESQQPVATSTAPDNTNTNQSEHQCTQINQLSSDVNELKNDIKLLVNGKVFLLFN